MNFLLRFRQLFFVGLRMILAVMCFKHGCLPCCRLVVSLYLRFVGENFPLYSSNRVKAPNLGSIISCDTLQCSSFCSICRNLSHTHLFVHLKHQSQLSQVAYCQGILVLIIKVSTFDSFNLLNLHSQHHYYY